MRGKSACTAVHECLGATTLEALMRHSGPSEWPPSAFLGAFNAL